MGVGCDVTDEDQVVAAISKATERFGGVDILVNGAALFNFKGVLNMPVDEWRRQTDIILTGAFLFTKHVAHLMIQQNRKGNIINIISTAGHQGEPGDVGYGTAKAGLINFTRSVAMELAEYGIRVNSLTPTANDQSEGRERAATDGAWIGRHPARVSVQRDYYQTPAEARLCSSSPARHIMEKPRSSWHPTTLK